VCGGCRVAAPNSFIPMSNITIKGKEYHVKQVQIDDPSLEVPYELVPVNGRGKSWRLLRNKPNPKHIFPICGMNVGNFWLEEQSDGTLKEVA